MFTQVFVKDAHDAPIYALSGNSTQLYTAGSDRLIRRWHWPNGQQDAFNVQHTHSPMALACIGDKTLAVGYLNGDIYLIDTPTKTVLFHDTLSGDSAVSFYFDKTLNCLLIGTANGMLSALDLTSKQWLYEDRVATGKIRKILALHQPSKVCFSSQSGEIGYFDVHRGVLVHSFMAHGLGANGLVVRNGLMLSGGKDGFLRLWDPESCALIHEIPAHKGVIYDLLAFEDCWVSGSRDKSIKVWDRVSLKPIQKLSLHRQSVNALLQQNEHSFVSVSDDKKMAYWTQL